MTEREKKALDAAVDNLRNAWTALRMIRDAIEELGPPGALPSAETVLAVYGPEPVDEATAIVEELERLAQPAVQLTRIVFFGPRQKSARSGGLLACPLFRATAERGRRIHPCLPRPIGAIDQGAANPG